MTETNSTNPVNPGIALIKDKELHRIVATCIIYNPEGKYLITKRSPTKKVHPNKWTVPGGGLDVDDYIHSAPAEGHGGAWYNIMDSALRREIQEETNVVIGKIEFLLDLVFVRPDGIPVLTLSYYAPYISGDIKMDADTVDFKWVTPEEGHTYDLIEGIAEEIDMVAEKLKKN